MSEVLESCPFCGSDDVCEEILATGMCKSCGALGPAQGGGSHWNVRAPGPARLLTAAKAAEGTFIELYGPREGMPDDCEAAHVMDLLRSAIAASEAGEVAT